MSEVRETGFMDEVEIAGVNHRFQAEVGEYGLRYRCVDCAHMVPIRQSCSLGYPNEWLTQGGDRARDCQGRFVFCKEFELTEGEA